MDNVSYEPVAVATYGRRVRSRRMVAAFLALMLLLAACGGGGDDTTDADPEVATDAPVTEPSEPDEADAPTEDDVEAEAPTEPEAAEDEPTEDVEVTGDPETSELTVGILPTPDYAPIIIALEEGYFEEEGLQVETGVIAPGQAVPGVVGGTYQFAGVNWITFVLSVNSGIPLVPVLELDRGVAEYAQLLVTSESEIQTLDDLSGRDIAVVATPGNCDVLPLDAMQQQGIEEAPSFVNFAIPDMPGTLQRGGVDAACVPQPLLGALLASGDFRSVHDVFDGEYEGFPIVGVSTSSEFAEANPNTVEAFRRALIRGAETARTDDQAVRDVLPLYTNFTPEQAEVVVLPDYPVGLEQDRLALTTEIMNRVGIFDVELETPTLP